MAQRLAVLLLLLAAGQCPAAEDPNAPLAGSKQELKKLLSDEAAKNSGAASAKLKDALPVIAAPQMPSAAPSLPMPRQREQQAMKSGQGGPQDTNWLLNGYDGLRANRSKARGEHADRNPEVADPGSPADPGYFIRLYQSQSKDARPERLPAGQDRQGYANAMTAQNDPLAPFLSGWLANSPVRDLVMGPLNPAGAKRRPGDESLLGEDGKDFGAADSNQAHKQLTGSNAGSGQTPVNGNPFLQPSALPGAGRIPDDAHGTRMRSAASSHPTQPSSAYSTKTPATPAPKPPATTYAAPASKQDSDKKYFPQLKRF